MKTAITYSLNKIFKWLPLLLLLGQRLAAGTFSTYTPITATDTNDLLLIDQWVSGTTWVTKNETASNFLSKYKGAAIFTNTNSVFYGTGSNMLLMGGNVSNAVFQNMLVVPTNGNPGVPFCTFATVTGTAGKTYITLNCSPTAAITNFNLGDTLLVTNTGSGTVDQMVIVGMTNGNFTASVDQTYGNNPHSYTAAPFLWQPAQVQLFDTVPRRVGAIYSGGSFGVATASIGNNGGNISGFTLFEGIDTGHITERTPGGGQNNFMEIGTGYGWGNGAGSQIQIESGSLWNNLRILSNNIISIRGPITNVLGTNIDLWNNTAVHVQPAFTAASSTVSGTNGNNFMLWTDGGSANYSFLRLGDTITANGGAYSIVGIQTAPNVLTVTPQLSSTFIGAAVTVQQSPLFTTNSGSGTYTSITPNGSVGIVPGVNSTYSGGVYWYAGTNSARVYCNTNTGDLFLSVGYPNGGSRGDAVRIQNGAIFNSLWIQSNSIISLQAGITNGNANQITNYNGTVAPYFGGFTNFYTAQPSIVTNAPGLGTGGSVTIDATASAAAVNITLVVGAGNTVASSLISTYTYGITFPTAPHFMMCPANANAYLATGNSGVIGATTTTTFTLTTGTSALSAGTYKWNVFFIE